MSCIFRGRHSTLETSSHVAWQEQHFRRVALRALHSTLHCQTVAGVASVACCDMRWRSKFHTPHLTLYTPHLHFTLHTLQFTLHTLHLTLYTLHSALHTLHPTLHTLHFTLPLYTLHCVGNTPHSTLHTPRMTLYTPYFRLYTLHFPPRTWLFTLYMLHFTSQMCTLDCGCLILLLSWPPPRFRLFSASRGCSACTGRGTHTHIHAHTHTYAECRLSSTNFACTWVTWFQDVVWQDDTVQWCDKGCCCFTLFHCVEVALPHTHRYADFILRALEWYCFRHVPWGSGDWIFSIRLIFSIIIELFSIRIEIPKLFKKSISASIKIEKSNNYWNGDWKKFNNFNYWNFSIQKFNNYSCCCRKAICTSFCP